MTPEDIKDLRDELRLAVGNDKKTGLKITKIARDATNALLANDEKTAKLLVNKMKNFSKSSGASKSNNYAGIKDINHAKQIAIDSIQSGMTGSLQNLRQKLEPELKKVLDPQEYAKFVDEIMLYKKKGADLVKVIKNNNSFYDVEKLRMTARDYTNWARNQLHEKAKAAILARGEFGWTNKKSTTGTTGSTTGTTGTTGSTEVPAEIPEIKTPEEVVDDWFIANGIDINDFVVLDPEEELTDPSELDKLAFREEFAEKLKNMMSESFEKSYKEATKRLL